MVGVNLQRPSRGAAAYCHLPTAYCSSEAHVLFGRALFALGADLTAVVPLGVEVDEGEDGDGLVAGDLEAGGRAAEADDDGAADDARAELLDDLDPLLDGPA